MENEDGGRTMKVKLLRDVIVNPVPGRGAVAGRVGEEFNVPVSDGRLLESCGAAERVEQGG